MKSFQVNPVHANGLFLYVLQTSGNHRLPDVFRGYRKRPVAWHGLTWTFPYFNNRLSQRNSLISLFFFVTMFIVLVAFFRWIYRIDSVFLLHLTRFNWWIYWNQLTIIFFSLSFSPQKFHANCSWCFAKFLRKTLLNYIFFFVC